MEYDFVLLQNTVHGETLLTDIFEHFCLTRGRLSWVVKSLPEPISYHFPITSYKWMIPLTGPGTRSRGMMNMYHGAQERET